MSGKSLLKELSESYGVSGYEFKLNSIIEKYFKDISDSINTDTLGNIIIKKNGKKSSGKIMLAAHMDEIGLMVKGIDKKGYVSFTNIGGIDVRTLPCQEVVIHGKEDVYGVIGMLPPHIAMENKNESVKMKDMTIDTGYSKEELESLIEIGDVISIKRDFIELLGSKVAGKAIDDRAGVATVFEIFKRLEHINHDVDVYGVITVQEEVGTRGAITSTYDINPDIGFAIDVGFGKTPELSEYGTIELGKGPGIGYGANVHPKVFTKLKDIANQESIKYQLEIIPDSSGTDAWPMQISRDGVATSVISIPQRYMHTSVETIDYDDVNMSARLLSNFILSLNNENMEEFLCY